MEHVTPALFNAAVSGNTELLYSVLEDGDDVNPMVSILHHNYITLHMVTSV